MSISNVEYMLKVLIESNNMVKTTIKLDKAPIKLDKDYLLKRLKEKNTH